MLAQRLSAPPFVDRRVVDKTGLAGQYDFTLYCRSMGGLPPGPDDNAPGIELALQEQLGLKLALSVSVRGTASGEATASGGEVEACWYQEDSIAGTGAGRTRIS
jgi:hypothetical protein